MKFTRTLLLLVLFIPLSGCIKSVVQSGMPKLESGKPTGTLYVGYRDKTLPSGTRVVLINNNAAFRINMGQYTKIKLNPGNYKIRLECVRVKGFHGMDSAHNTSFQMVADTEVYFMIKWDANCKRPAKDHIRQVIEKDKQALIKSYKLVTFTQNYAEKREESKTKLHVRQKPLASNTQTENTPLFEAAKEGDVNKVRKLVNKGYDITAVDENGATAVLIALKYGHFQTANKLLGFGSDVNHKDNDGRTPLHY